MALLDHKRNIIMWIGMMIYDRLPWLQGRKVKNDDIREDPISTTYSTEDAGNECCCWRDFHWSSEC